jgi:hypothetical protein
MSLDENIAETVGDGWRAVGKALGAAAQGAILFGVLAFLGAAACAALPPLLPALSLGHLAAAGAALVTSLTNSYGTFGFAAACGVIGAGVGAVVMAGASLIPTQEEKDKQESRQNTLADALRNGESFDVMQQRESSRDQETPSQQTSGQEQTGPEPEGAAFQKRYERERATNQENQI